MDFYVVLTRWRYERNGIVGTVLVNLGSTVRSATLGDSPSRRNVGTRYNLGTVGTNGPIGWDLKSINEASTGEIVRVRNGSHKTSGK